MGIRQAIWRVDAVPVPLPDAALPSEKSLEDIIVAAPPVLSDEWMLIGRQEPTGYGGRVDLLAIAPDAALVLIELKRDRTPREVVAQALDYASWVEELGAIEISAIYERFAAGHNLADDFKARFGQALDEDSLNAAHQIVVVSAALDDSSERIVRYLNARGIAINVLCFQVFQDQHGLLLSRAWLLDPVRAQAGVVASIKGASEPWNGEFYASFGHGPSRSWPEAVEYGFISGGGGSWYSKTLQLLKPGDRVWVRVPGAGYVGVARVTGEGQRASEFMVATPQGPRPAFDVLTMADYHRSDADDAELCEYFVPVVWLETRPLNKAIQEIGLFGNQNTVCQPVAPKWRHTVDRLEELMPGYALTTPAAHGVATASEATNIMAPAYGHVPG
ncbi:MAG: nuclease [Candidatus Limnocylindrales bacterium]